MTWYLKVLNNYASFRGRARRKEYWIFTLVNVVFTIVAIVLDNLVRLTFEGSVYGFLSTAYILATIVPSFSVLVRRLHDIGKSGWYVLVYFVPLLGGLILLAFTVTDGDYGENDYGPDPKDEERNRPLTFNV